MWPCGGRSADKSYSVDSNVTHYFFGNRLCVIGVLNQYATVAVIIYIAIFADIRSNNSSGIIAHEDFGD